MSSIWDNRWQGINALELNYRNAQVHRSDSGDWWTAAEVHHAFGDYTLAQEDILNCLWSINTCLTYLIDTHDGYDPPQAMTNFLYHYTWPYTETEEYELTAAKIMAAWIEANVDDRLMTVLTLDELRREAWTEEFYSYRIAAAPHT